MTTADPAAGPLRRARAATAIGFAVQGLAFASVLTHLPTFKDRWGLDDRFITVLMLGVARLVGVARWPRCRHDHP